jgi:hypothetical protein
METTGKLISVSPDLLSGKLNITFQIDTKPEDELRRIARIECLDIKADKRRRKRSLDANAYFHVLVGKIAEAETISKAKAKNILISRYGQVETLPDGSPLVYKTNAPVEYMMELESIHSIPVKYTDEATFYKIYRGSHTYDSYEMSKLIEGTVADAKELGIETLTPKEIQRMVEVWHEKAF